MSVSDVDWSAAYAANEAIWYDETAKASSRMTAWRKQKLLLQHATRNMNDTMHFSVHKEHHDKLEAAKCTENYFKDRLAASKTLLTQSRRLAGGSLGTLRIPHDWKIPQPEIFEAPCRGVYESCQHNEITDDELLSLEPTEEVEAKMSSNNEVKIAERSALPRDVTVAFYSKQNDAKQILAASVQTATDGINAPQADGLVFRSAREEQMLRDMQTGTNYTMDYRKKSLGVRRGARSNFVPPVSSNGALKLNDYVHFKKTDNVTAAAAEEEATSSGSSNPQLAHLDAKMVEEITRTSMHKLKPVAWDDIGGLEYAKSTFMEDVILPMQRPDIFKGLLRPPRGILLFGPPGTGKTMIAKCIASQSGATFFSINPSSLTSKWIGDGEKMVKTLFAVAAAHKPSIIFMDEVDSLLSQRSQDEHESSRRMKNEFFIQLDGATTNDDEYVLIIGATNRPQELDEAVRRRFERRLYVALPELKAREQILLKLIQQMRNDLNAAQVLQLAEATAGYSGADLHNLVRCAAKAPLRSLSMAQMAKIEANELRPVTVADFYAALPQVSRSVSKEDTEQYKAWNKVYGAQC